MDQKYNGYNPQDYSDEYTYRRPRSSSKKSSGSEPGSSTSRRQSTSGQKRNTHSVSEPHNSGTPAKNNSTGTVSKRVSKKKKMEKRRRRFRGFLSGLLIVAIVFTIVGTGVFVGMYAAVMTEIEDMNIDTLVKNQSSFAYYTDASGKIQELEMLSTTNNSIWVDAAEINNNVKNAAVAIEDERFYKHNGIDLKRTFGATVKYALSKVGIGDASYGGSTITQQVIKNITKEKDKSATRKIKEILRAMALEKQCTKDEILTLYLNIVYFANQCYGVESAAQLYYGKSANQLSVPEAAAIVGITQTPSKFDPYAHPENTLDKRNVVLKKMYELDMIDRNEYKSASESALGVVPKKVNNEKKISSYFVDQVVLDVMNDLQTQKAYSSEFAEQQVFNGGLKIYTTMDLGIQQRMESIYQNTSNFPNSGIQSAMVVIDPYTGAVKGMVGGIGQKTARGLNRATQSTRQPGSAIKPLSVYAPCLENEVITEGTVVKDEKITIGSDNWEPKNSYSGFKGNMLAVEALGRSANIPAVKFLEMLGITKSYNFMEKKLGFTTLVNDDKNYSSLALGGLTKGVTVEEMASAYSVFANGGKYYKPYTYTKVVNALGEVILENSAVSEAALSSSTAYVMADMLSYPVTASYGTGRSADLGNMPTYGKTGTTNDNYDKWFVGFTPYYVGAVWYGYDQPKAISASSNPAVAVWKKVMASIHENLTPRELNVPSGVREISICKNSGNLPGSGCSKFTAYFKPGTEPSKRCSSHYSRGATTGNEDKKKTETPEKSSTPSPTKATSKPTEKSTNKPTAEPTKAPVTKEPTAEPEPVEPDVQEPQKTSIPTKQQ